jgi:ribosome-binding protein aMBF1 (putative translation factor)
MDRKMQIEKSCFGIFIAVCYRVPTMSRTIFSERQEVLQNLVRSVRLEAGLTQVELANRLQRPQSFVSKIESGERLMDIVELKEVCDALDVRLVDFVARFEREIS